MFGRNGHYYYYYYYYGIRFYVPLLAYANAKTRNDLGVTVYIQQRVEDSKLAVCHSQCTWHLQLWHAPTRCRLMCFHI
jgi:hypothetical protein